MKQQNQDASLDILIPLALAYVPMVVGMADVDGRIKVGMWALAVLGTAWLVWRITSARSFRVIVRVLCVAASALVLLVVLWRPTLRALHPSPYFDVEDARLTMDQLDRGLTPSMTVLMKNDSDDEETVDYKFTTTSTKPEPASYYSLLLANPDFFAEHMSTDLSEQPFTRLETIPPQEPDPFAFHAPHSVTKSWGDKILHVVPLMYGVVFRIHHAYGYTSVVPYCRMFVGNDAPPFVCHLKV